MVPVILGILIALLVNNWNESRSDKKFVQSVLAAVANELTDNKAELQESITEHEIFIDTLDVYLRNDSVSVVDIINKCKGLGGVSIRNASWKSFLNPKIELVDYKVISILTDIEESKQIMATQIEKMVDIVYGNFNSVGFQEKLRLKLVLNDILYTEKDLLALHEDFLTLNKF
jgi:hypothetical protein